MAERHFADHITTETNEEVRIEIHDSDFGGSATKLKGTGSGWASRSVQQLDVREPLSNPIQKSEVSATLWLKSSSLIDDLFSSEEGRFTLIYKKESTEYFEGEILPDLCDYDYLEDDALWKLTVKAKDLSALEGEAYTFATGRETIIEAIASILPYSKTIKTHTSWIVDGTTTANDYLRQTYVDKFALRQYASAGGESDEAITKLQALEWILKSNGLILTQEGGWVLDHITAMSDPTDVLESNYDASGAFVSASNVDLSNTAKIVLSSKYNHNPGIKSARLKYEHRTKISGIKIPSVLVVTGNSDEEFTQLFISDGNQEINLVSNVNAYVNDSLIEFGDRGYAVFKIQAGSYWWNGSSWGGTETDFRTEIFGPFDSDGNKVYNGAINILTASPPADADGNLVLTFLQSEYERGGTTFNFDETEFLNSSISVVNPVADENSSSIDFQLTQSGNQSVRVNYGSIFFGDGPSANSRGGFSTDSSGTLTTDDWARRGEVDFVNHAEILLREIVDVQRKTRARISATVKSALSFGDVISYDGSNYFILGGSFDGYTGVSNVELLEINIQTATDTFEDLPKFEQTGTSGSSSGSIVDIVEQNDNTYPWQRTVISEVASLPGSPSTGDRYLFDGNPHVWNGTEWLTFEPEEGWTLYNEDLGKYMVFETRDSQDWYVWDGLNFFQNGDTDYSTVSSGAGSGYRGTYYGFDSNGTGDGQTKLGYNNSGDIGDYTLSLGYEALKDNIYDNVVGIGRGAVATANNQFILAQTNVNATPLIKGNFSTGLTTLQSLEIGETGHGFDSDGNLRTGYAVITGSTDTTLRIQSTFSGNWDYDNENYGKIEFYSSDSSAPGVGIKGSIKSVVQRSIVGGRGSLLFSTANDSTNDNPVLELTWDAQINAISGGYQISDTTVIDSSRNHFGVNGTFTGNSSISGNLTVGGSASITGTLSAPNLIESASYTGGTLTLTKEDASTFTAGGFYEDWTISTPSDSNTIDVVTGRTIEFRGTGDVTVTSGEDVGAFFVDIDFSESAPYNNWNLHDGGVGSGFDVDSGDRVEITGSGATTVTITDSSGDAPFNVDISSTDTQPRSDEYIEDVVGGMLSGNTETLITVTYQDGDGTIDFVVDNDLSNYSNATSSFATTSQLYAGWNVTADSGTQTPLLVESNDTVNLIGGTNTTVSRTGNDITITASAPAATYIWELSDGSLNYDIEDENRVEFTDSGASTVTVTDQGSGLYTVNVSSTDTNTTYTAGSGLDLSGTEFSLDTDAIFSGFSVVIDDGGVGTPFEMPDSNALLTIKAGDRISLAQNDGEITITADAQGGGTMSDWNLLVGGVSEQTVTDDDNVNFTGGTGIIADYVSAAVDYRIDTTVVPVLNDDNDFGSNTLFAFDFDTSSDLRGKKGWGYSNMNAVNELYNFKLIEWEHEGRTKVGFGAQHIEEWHPEFVTSINDALKLNYRSIFSLNVKATNEHTEQLSDHERRIKDLETENEKLKKQLNAYSNNA